MPVGAAFRPRPLRPEMGLLTLTLPSSRAQPGRPLRLKVTGSDFDSRRWFGVCRIPPR
jgi:hypothetical protein